jgi:predicted PurR-regulated permease PerM
MRNYIPHDKIPGYLKISILLVGLIAFFYIIYATQNILLPFVFSVLVAVLLDPLVMFLHRKRMNRIVAITLVLLVAILLMGALIFFIVSQFNSFSDDLPSLKSKFNNATAQAVGWVSDTFHLSVTKVSTWLAKKRAEGLNNSTALIGDAATTLSHFFILILIIPVYIFLLLFYKPLILTFISKLFPVKLHSEVVEVLSEIRSLIQHYLVGLLIEMAIVATLTSIGLAIIGIQSPILFGIITALLNVIPYVGVLVANLTFVSVAYITKSPTAAILVFILYGVVQFIDNNIVVPRIVGAKVKINALATIVIVLIGGELCGIAGMFLAIPVLAAFKVIFDHIRPLEPLGFLLGDSQPGSGKEIFQTDHANAGEAAEQEK